jgi:hypothetical protein
MIACLHDLINDAYNKDKDPILTFTVHLKQHDGEYEAEIWYNNNNAEKIFDKVKQFLVEGKFETKDAFCYDKKTFIGTYENKTLEHDCAQNEIAVAIAEVLNHIRTSSSPNIIVPYYIELTNIGNDKTVVTLYHQKPCNFIKNGNATRYTSMVTPTIDLARRYVRNYLEYKNQHTKYENFNFEIVCEQCIVHIFDDNDNSCTLNNLAERIHYTLDGEKCYRLDIVEKDDKEMLQLSFPKID